MKNIDKSLEFSVISAMFFDPALIEESILKPVDFEMPILAKIYQLMQKFSKDGLPIDEDFILKKVPNDKLEEYQNALIEILATTPISNIRAYEIEIKENAKKRALQTLLNNSKKLLEEKTSKDILKTISKEIEALEDDYKTNSILNIKDLKDIEIENPKFLLEKILPIQENEINIFSANGGSGKSYLIAYLLLELARIGKKSFAWFSEDALGVTKSRLLKLVNLHTHLEINNITIVGKENQPIQFVERTSKKLEINDKFEKLKKELKEYDIIVLDPLIAFYGGDENNNSEARYFMALLNKWCEDDKKTIILVHHNNKVDKEGNSSSRGASAFIDACRMQYSIHSNKDDDRYRIAKIEKTNHFSGNKEYKIKLFDTKIVFENEKIAENITKNPQNNKFSSLIS